MSKAYATIVADPPWPFRWNGGGEYRVNGRGERHISKKVAETLPYKTMSIEEIAALPVADLVADDANLFLWIPDQLLIAGVGLQVCQAWGFSKAERLLVWKKTGYGLGTFPRPQHEALIVAKRGSLPFQVRNVGSVLTFGNPYENGARAHSRKPDGMLDQIESASPGPYLELFARRARLGDWDYWGDESLQTVEMPDLSETAA